MTTNSSIDKPEAKSNVWFDEQDEQIFDKFEMVGGKYIPPQSEFLKHLDNYTNGKEFKLQWKCIGHRAPTPENQETNEHEDDQFPEVENTIDDGDFEFEDELNQLNLSSVRRNATPKGSAKKTKTTSLQSILSNIARHRKIDMLGTEDELKNKMKQEQQQSKIQGSTLNQSEFQNENQNLGEENLSQSSESQSLQESTLHLENNEVESNSNSQQDDSLHSFLNKNETSHGDDQNNFNMESEQFTLDPKGSHQALQSGNLPSSENHQNQPKQVQLDTQQLQIFQHQLPQQTNNLNFQNILNRNPEPNQPSNLDNLQESTQNKTSGPEAGLSSTSPTSQAQQILNQSSQVTTTTSTSLVQSQSLQSQNFQNHDSLSNKELESVRIKESMETDQNQAESSEMLGSDLPLPEESKHDLSEFDFEMDE
ncbi:probable E3 ubiquitin-protein ligase bre1 isoform X2 [Diaphorina citri]|uniref:Probable E3 ubiquitin-protein ligase bre1 isoform X1 n=1 Tax=Diaphorina citri TaxID=121845 RepID=A0A3Q0IQX8_DIACI|nr:probable E3 ubiquitin-protein ligase bre1 isoform X1 [Diaphorina citri]XP_026678691.1 probable E3 ubiquitin-protein ligase bre1 isoform X2 [Diaphorina citri]